MQTRQPAPRISLPGAATGPAGSTAADYSLIPVLQTAQHRERNSLSLRKVPSYTALRNLLIQIDPHKLADCLNQWLGANLGTLPRALAVDGK